METTKLKRFAQYARRSLIDQVEAKLKFVLMGESAARRENPEAVKELEKQIQLHGQAQVIDKVAYTWLNRFCALRFMDVNGYTRIRVVSPLDGQFQPEILAEAKMGHIDEDMVPTKVRDQISALLNGTASSRDPQQEAYRLLMAAVCNDFHRGMPYLFERIADYTELLMPDDLLSGNSILAYTREAMTPDVCQDVEVIGWLYQFYISEKKDEVFEGLKKSKKITPENIPAATQLFTPHWIVRYLVENSLGRLWMLNNPSSRLIEQMDYYIKPQANENGQTSADFLRVYKPEDIKICDPACGSGHMLTYAFDLLYAIYEETGTDASEIPEKILTHNLYGIEIDERAGELAAFALTMKARDKQRRFFNKGIRPNICVLQNIIFDQNELNEYISVVGRDLFTQNLRETLTQFEEADNFGSLIRPKLTDVVSLLPMLEAKDMAGNLFLAETHRKVLMVLKQADYLSPKYHIVIANPPYMGGKGMNGRMGAWLKENYADVKSDLFSAFMVRNTELALPKGLLGFMSPFVWMFISSYDKLRDYLINQKTITSLVQLEYSGFDGATVPICTFTIENAFHPEFKGGYIRLSDFRGSENQSPRTLQAIKNPDCGWFYRTSAFDFKNIPGSPIAYWLSKKTIEKFVECKLLGDLSELKQGMSTTDSDRFVRNWFEVNRNKIALDCISAEEGNQKGAIWFPFNKGGKYRKWFGNNEQIVRYEKNGEILINLVRDKYPNISDPEFVIKNRKRYFKESVTYTAISSSKFGVRIMPKGFIFSIAGPVIQSEALDNNVILSLLLSPVAQVIVSALSPTLNFQAVDLEKIPVEKSLFNGGGNREAINKLTRSLINISKMDWDSYETSWDFSKLPLLETGNGHSFLKANYSYCRKHLKSMTLEMQKLEEENNRIFIDAYDLQDELFPNVQLSEVTLTCNPNYRYGGIKSEQELESLLLSDTMRELISYAVGCMFGRYSLDKPGLILANQGETLKDYLHQVTEPTFTPDSDNVIPMLDGDWFTDDISERFRVFLRVSFGEEHYEENLHFIEEALGKNGKPLPIRDYFLRDFYSDHIKRYKKRPIYWLFSSPKGSFNALIYMHRYRPDTVSVILNDYLREFRTKLSARKDHLEQLSINPNASSADKTKSLKELEILKKMLVELDEYERDVLYPLATQQIEIDLDDGVKVNYLKFGSALKKIPSLDAKDEE